MSTKIIPMYYQCKSICLNNVNYYLWNLIIILFVTLFGRHITTKGCFKICFNLKITPCTNTFCDHYIRPTYLQQISISSNMWTTSYRAKQKQKKTPDLEHAINIFINSQKSDFFKKGIYSLVDRWRWSLFWLINLVFLKLDCFSIFFIKTTFHMFQHNKVPGICYEPPNESNYKYDLQFPY